MLIAHGEEDTRVFSSQSKNMVKALKAQGKLVEWMPLEKVGHGFFWVRDEVRYFTAVLKFLDRHIGDGREAVEDAKSKSAEPHEEKSKIE